MKRLTAFALPLFAVSLAACASPDIAEDEADDGPIAEAGSALQSVTTFSVIIASDPQLYWSIDDITGAEAASLGWSDTKVLDFANKTNFDQATAFNKLLDGSAMISGYVKPSFVIVNGNLTGHGESKERVAYEAYYPTLLKAPVYPGLGSRDIGPELVGTCAASSGELSGATQKCLSYGDCEAFTTMQSEGGNFCGNESRRWMQSWTTTNRGKLNSYDPGSLSYSWSKNGIRFVEMHNYVTYSQSAFGISSTPAGYLRSELAVATSLGERVVLNLNDFGGHVVSPTTIDCQDMELTGPLHGYEYNVIGIFAGRFHGLSGLQGDVEINGVHIPWFRSGSATWNHALLAQFSATGMKVVPFGTRGGAPQPEKLGAHLTSTYMVSHHFDSSAEYDKLYPVNPCPAGYQPKTVGGACALIDWQRITAGMVEGAAEAGDRMGSVMVRGDFNADGYMDLAVGAALEDVGSVDNSGAISVIYGGPSGLNLLGNKMFHLATTGIPGDPSKNDYFGQALASGDFNGDGYADLAVGAPGRTVNGNLFAGEVYVLFGSASGIVTTGVQEWSQDSPGVTDSAEHDDSFGQALAAGDFNGDGLDDLAIGVPRETLVSSVGGAVTYVSGAGLVQVLRGSAAGLVSQGDPGFSEAPPSMVGYVASGDMFGWSLASGDFNGDGRDDLAIGSPYQDVVQGPTSIDFDAGTIHIISGSDSGLLSDSNVRLVQGDAGVGGTLEGGDRFGWALAVGDFNGDGKDDLAVSALNEGIGSALAAGAVHVLNGAQGGLPAGGSVVFHEDTSGIVGNAEGQDWFGAALTTGDFNGDGKVDLAISATGKTINGASGAGEVHVLLSAEGGLSAASDSAYNQGDYGVGGEIAGANFFGEAVCAGDWNGDGKADLAISAPSASVAGLNAAGLVDILHGSSTGITTTRSAKWSQTF